MVLVKFLEDLLHDGLTEKNGFGIDLETAAIFGYCSHFLIIEVDHLSVPSYEGILFPAEEPRIDLRCHLSFSQFRNFFFNYLSKDKNLF